MSQYVFLYQINQYCQKKVDITIIKSQGKRQTLSMCDTYNMLLRWQRLGGGGDNINWWLNKVNFLTYTVHFLNLWIIFGYFTWIPLIEHNTLSKAAYEHHLSHRQLLGNQSQLFTPPLVWKNICHQSSLSGCYWGITCSRFCCILFLSLVKLESNLKDTILFCFHFVGLKQGSRSCHSKVISNHQCHSREEREVDINNKVNPSIIILPFVQKWLQK